MPFERVRVGEWLLEVDRQATQAAYRDEHAINVCGCAGCQNYYAACRAGAAHSPATLALFQRLGIDPEKEAEVYTFYGNQERTQAYYGGFYHLVGRIIESAAEQQSTLIDDRFEVAFTEQVHLLSQTFPQPALQMEFTAWLPWVLEGQHDTLAPPALPQEDREKDEDSGAIDNLFG